MKDAKGHGSDTGDAHSTAMSQLRRYSDQGAASALSSGTPKSAPAPVHDAQSSYNEHGSRHGYNPEAVNNAIKNNRTGKIGGREASAIHRLLKGR